MHMRVRELGSTSDGSSVAEIRCNVSLKSLM